MLPYFSGTGPFKGVPQAPKLLENLQNISVDQGNPVVFQSKVEGNPPPQVYWLRETTVVKSTHEFQQLVDKNGFCTLTIREAFPDDSGKFTVIAKNCAGVALSTAELKVKKRKCF